jgi:glycosyltransferase involved in cell wall biosynthesis
VTLQPVGTIGVRLSVVVTTYNNPRALALVLAGLFRQSIRDFEIIVADDGSGPDTARLIAECAAGSPVPLRHLWHPDEGFRKCTITNQAILSAGGDYVVFFDGDCVPRGDCLAQHLAAARRDSYLTGGKIPLAPALADRLTVCDVERGILDGVGLWWRHVGKPRRLLASRLPLVREWMNRRVPREPSWRGENASAFAEHLHVVGGFDERFTYGYEDADLGHRLQAAGVHGRSIRYTAPVFHLEHPRPYADPRQVEVNRALYRETRSRRLSRTPYGLRCSNPATRADSSSMSPSAGGPA